MKSTQSEGNEDFSISEISDEIFAKMQGKSYKENCTVPREDLLTKLRFLHAILCRHILQDFLLAMLSRRPKLPTFRQGVFRDRAA